VNVRKNIYTLTDAQLQDFKDAVNALKTAGTYDTFIAHHHHSMMTPTPWQAETPDTQVRNVAHRGPAFLPWHRYFCREFELALQTVRVNVTLPYWDWGADAAAPLSAPLWNTNPSQRIYIGGDGTGPGGTVNTGPFAGWIALIEDAAGNLVPRPGGILRDLGAYTTGNPDFPTVVQIDDAIQNMAVYDTAPWNLTSDNSFRNRLEGWRNKLAGESSPHLHNRIHVWVGGDMGPGTSPNDPVFFLHHCNVDRLWAQWQHTQPGSGYEPTAGGPVGHNLNDVMQHLTIAGATPANSLDYRRTLGFIYDTDPPLVDLATPNVSFQDVPTLETTWRAAVFHVRAGSTIHLDVVSGSGPNPPYSLTALGGSVTHTPPVDNAPYDEVRVWFAFTGAAAPGPAAAGAVQVRCAETNDVFDISLTGNTVARPTTGVVFCLDKSGSMSQPAGTGTSRIQLLHEAAARCVELIRDGSGAGTVSFDQDAYPGEPLAAFAAANTHRNDVVTAVNALAPGGATSIGDGVELARTTLIAGQAGFDGNALLVLTDGLENQPKYLSQVGSSIDTRTFAIGLGTAQQVSTAALSTIANGTGGYLLLTGPLTPATDSYFLLSKYFQQILVSATNENIVIDPSGFLAPGNTVTVPFAIAETEIDFTTILLVDVPAIRLALKTPAGTILSENDLAALGAQIVHGTNMTYARVALPLPIAAGAHGGTWQVVLRIDSARYKRALSALEREAERNPQLKNDLDRLRAHGARWNITISSWSNVRLAARVTQTSFEPGATLRLDATLTEYSLPVDRRATVDADVTRPDGATLNLSVPEEAPGTFAATLPAGMDGVWRIHFHARGTTHGGSPFIREQLASAAIITGGDRPWPQPPERDPLQCLLDCITLDKEWVKWLREHGLDPRGLRECLERCQDPLGTGELDRLG
jgi:Common central domain of tyrosinase/von Willebrand factor type A domain